MKPDTIYLPYIVCSYEWCRHQGVNLFTLEPYDLDECCKETIRQEVEAEQPTRPDPATFYRETYAELDALLLDDNPHPLPENAPVITLAEGMKGVIVEATKTSSGYRYTVLISPDVWNATPRRPTDRAEMLYFYDTELTPAPDGEIAPC